MNLSLRPQSGVAVLIIAIGCQAPTSPSTVGTSTATPPALAPAPATAQSAPAGPTADASVVAKTYTLANGHSVYMACVGTGSPTVVLEAGDHGGGASIGLTNLVPEGLPGRAPTTV